jgi:UvrB/uvrC motif
MNHNLDSILKAWTFQPGALQVRTVQTGGREVIQIRVDLGILQLEPIGRPDGTRPFGFATFFDYIRHHAEQHEGDLTLDEEQCAEADREFVQFYQRRVSWLVLQRFDRAVADADHTLAFMDFVRDHAPSEEYAEEHEQHRGFVLFQRTQAAAAAAVANGKPEQAVDAIRQGVDHLRGLAEAADDDNGPPYDGLVQALLQTEDSLRQMHGIGETLQEKLARAVANEEYETAARLRDAIRRRQ